jgi:hypothetical protein
LELSFLSSAVAPSRPRPLQLAIELAFGLTKLSSQPLQRILFVYARFGLNERYAVGNLEGSARSLSTELGQGLHQQGDFASDAISGCQFLPCVGYSSAQELLMNLGQLAGYDYPQIRSPDCFKINERLENSVWRLVKDQRAR